MYVFVFDLQKTLSERFVPGGSGGAPVSAILALLLAYCGQSRWHNITLLPTAVMQCSVLHKDILV